MRLVGFLVFFLSTLDAAAQYALEIVPLRHATAEQVLPILRPLLEPGGTLSSSANQLFVRASASNVAELKRVLDTIDRPARRLQVLVRLDSAADRSQRELGATGGIGNRGSNIEIRAQDASGGAGERVDQQLTLLEGGRGFIATGRSDPLRERASGFEVVPRVSGDTVTLDIAQQRESGDQFQRLSTTVSARLGEWVEVGGVADGGARDERGILSSGHFASSSSRRVWLKVVELGR
jgi:hypothetical protein